MVLDGAGARVGIVVCIAHKKPAQLGYVLLPGVQDVWNHPNVIFAEWMFCFAITFRMGKTSDVCWFINPSKYR